jgi:bifunctional non-homologous end joining protein LigD
MAKHSNARAGPRTRKNRPQTFRAPQLATLVDAVPTGAGWLHEIKYDGFRCLVAVGGGRARAYTRSGLDWSDKFGAVIKAAASIEGSALIDGEMVVLDEKGRSRFQLMQGGGARGQLVFYAFDVLEIAGEDLTRLPLVDRKKRLAKLIGRRKAGPIRYSHHVEDGLQFFETACASGLEGIISKRADARYAVGARTDTWLKVKCVQRQEFVLVGWTASDKDRAFRSLVVAVNERGKLRYAGKVGTGFGMAEMDRLAKLMKPLSRPSPTVDAPKAAVRGAHWIAPKLVAEVEFTEMTGDGILRHPSYVGLRQDKAAGAVVAERPKHLSKVEPSRSGAGRDRRKRHSPAASTLAPAGAKPSQVARKARRKSGAAKNSKNRK